MAVVVLKAAAVTVTIQNVIRRKNGLLRWRVRVPKGLEGNHGGLKSIPFWGAEAQGEVGRSVRSTERAMTKKARRKIDAALKAKIALGSVRERAKVADLLIHRIGGDIVTPLIQRRPILIPPALTLFGLGGILSGGPSAVILDVGLRKLYLDNPGAFSAAPAPSR